VVIGLVKSKTDYTYRLQAKEKAENRVIIEVECLYSCVTNARVEFMNESHVTTPPTDQRRYAPREKTGRDPEPERDTLQRPLGPQGEQRPQTSALTARRTRPKEKMRNKIKRLRKIKKRLEKT